MGGMTKLEYRILLAPGGYELVQYDVEMNRIPERSATDCRMAVFKATSLLRLRERLAEAIAALDANLLTIREVVEEVPRASWPAEKPPSAIADVRW